MKLRHFSELDGVRGLAAFMVIFFHYFNVIDPTNFLLRGLKQVAVFGQTGVSLFFVLSGFLITRILFNEKWHNDYFKNFFFRRALRIFPLYFLFLIIFYYLVPLVSLESNSAPNWYFWVYLQNIAMTFNWPNNGPSHFWSLAVEEHFYLFWPFVVFFFNERKVMFIGITLIIISFVFRFILTQANFESFYFTLTRMDDLVLGTFLAVFEKKKLITSKSKKYFSFAFIILLLLNLVPWLFAEHLSHFWLQIFKYPLISTLYFTLIGLLISPSANNFINIFNFSWLRFSGKISYGLYVYHPLVFMLSEKYFQINNVFIEFGCLLLLTVAVSIVSFYAYENQFLKLKKYFV
jgi:peptidoglycan/LPS O-acetylase OafA/YrhL